MLLYLKDSKRTLETRDSLDYIVTNVEKIVFLIDYDQLPEFPDSEHLLKLQIDFLYFILNNKALNQLLTVRKETVQM